MTEINDCGFIDHLKTIYKNLQFDENNCTVKVYEDIKTEYDTLIHGVAIRDFGSSGIIELKGSDTIDYLHRVSTNSIKNIQQNSSVFTLFTTDKGRIIDRTFYINLGEKQLLIGSRENFKKLYGWLNKYIIAEDIKTIDASKLYFAFEFYGPQSESFLTLMFGDSVSSLKDFDVKAVSYESTAFFLCKIKEFETTKFFVLGNIQHKKNFFTNLLEQKSVFDFKPAGENAFEIFRIQNGIPAAPNEINDAYNPHEINLINEVSFSKGCYIGQEVIARLDAYQKVQKNLVKIEFSEEPVINELPFKIEIENEQIGEITSIAKDPLKNKTKGLAIIRNEFLKEKNHFTFIDNDMNEIQISTNNSANGI